jgi:hypothetical protein
VADTEHHHPPGGTIFDEIPLDEEIDWRTIDRLIVLMSLTITLRLLRRRGKAMPDRVRFFVTERMKKLIDAYRRPTPRGRNHGRS